MALVNKNIALTDTTVLTVPTGKRYAITTLMVCNTQPEDTGGSNDSTFDLHFVPSGQTKGTDDPNANMILNDLKVAGADTFSFDTEKMVLDEGDKIIASGQSPANLVMTVSYLEV